MGLYEYKQELQKKYSLDDDVAEDIAIIYGSDLLASLGEEFLSPIENAMMTSSFQVGDNTSFSSTAEFDGTYTNAITIRRDYDYENPNHVAELMESCISSLWTKWSKSENTLVNNIGLATITYDISNGSMKKTSSNGTGIQEGLESYLLEYVMRENRNDNYSTTNCIYQEAVARWLMENGFREKVLVGAFTGNTKPLEEALNNVEIDYRKLESTVDTLEEAEQARKNGEMTPQDVQNMYIAFIPALMRPISESMQKQK